MPSPEPFLVFTRPLHALDLHYMISGSVAAIYYGEPRLTNDVDIILHMKAADVPRIAKAFPQEDFYCPPSEVISFERARAQRGLSTSLTTPQDLRRTSIFRTAHFTLGAWPTSDRSK